MSADGNVKNIAIYQDQKTVIPDGTIKLADAKDATIKQNSGSFYIMNNAGSAVVTVDITVGGVTKQYTLSLVSAQVYLFRKSALFLARSP